MMQALQSALSSYAGQDPYFKVMADLVALMPWWYPYMWLGIIGGVVFYRLLRWAHARLQIQRGIRRMQSRLARAKSSALQDPRALKYHRMSANDNFVLKTESETHAG